MILELLTVQLLHNSGKMHEQQNLTYSQLWTRNTSYLKRMEMIVRSIPFAKNYLRYLIGNQISKRLISYVSSLDRIYKLQIPD
jgi:hypothetical protein